MAATDAPPLLLLLLLFFFIPSSSLAAAKPTTGFSLKLTSALSRHSDRWTATVNGSLARLRHIEHITGAAPSIWPAAVGLPLFSADIMYLVSMQVGTPPLSQNLALDTASALTWLQCEPCTKCFPAIGDIYQPSQSSTFKSAHCDAIFCALLGNQTNCVADVCTYSLPYNTVASRGDLAFETFPPFVGDIVFGCGHDNSAPRMPPAMTGVAGFSMAPTSLVTQIGPDVQFKFSYCLRDHKDADPLSSLRFGDEAVLAGKATKAGGPDDELYYLTLLGISVGGTRLGIPPGAFRRNGNDGGVVLDSGSMLTFLNVAAYNVLEKYLKDTVKLEPRVPSGPVKFLCFAGSSADFANGKVPSMTFHFEGLDVPVKPENSFVDLGGGVICLETLPSPGVSLIGTLFQQNMHVGFDTREKLVYMSRAKC